MKKSRLRSQILWLLMLLIVCGATVLIPAIVFDYYHCKHLSLHPDEDGAIIILKDDESGYKTIYY